MMTPSKMNAVKEHYWITVLVTAVLSAVITAVTEYALTKGVSGVTPLVAVGIGLSVGVVLAGMQVIERRGSSSGPQPLKPNEVQGPTHTPSVGRDLSPRTPPELVAEVQGKTELAAKDTSKRHIGQWLRISGSIRDISSRSNSIEVMARDRDQTTVFFEFNSSIWRDRLAPLNIGDGITAIGKIDSISSVGYVRLEECELVDPC